MCEHLRSCLRVCLIHTFSVLQAIAIFSVSRTPNSVTWICCSRSIQRMEQKDRARDQSSEQKIAGEGLNSIGLEGGHGRALADLDGDIYAKPANAPRDSRWEILVGLARGAGEAVAVLPLTREKLRPRGAAPKAGKYRSGVKTSEWQRHDTCRKITLGHCAAGRAGRRREEPGTRPG